MDDKLVRLITCLAKQEDVSTSTLSESLCVSERTVRAYIKRAKELLSGIAEITTIKGQGYHLEVLNSWIAGLIKKISYLRLLMNAWHIYWTICLIEAIGSR